MSGRRFMRRPAPTARRRLTLTYAGLFLALGTVLILLVYFLTRTTTSVSAIAVSPAGLVQPASRFPRPAGDLVVSQHQADLNGLLAVSWVVLAITSIAAAGVGWVVSGRVLRPLRQMTATARTISAGDLSQRLAVQGRDDEIKRLGDTLDDLLGRLQGSFEAQRRFVANASHELRTPLAVDRTVLQVALADPEASSATLRAACEEVLASGREQERLLESLLTLAGSERPVEHVERVDLAAVATAALADVQLEIERRGIEVHPTLDPAAVDGDPALLRRLIANLVDNAARYNVPGGALWVTTASAEGRVTVVVGNTGQLIAAADVQRLFEPFQRLGFGRAAGTDGHHGLGLSIVRAIATAHGGSASAVARPDGGLEVTVELPSAPATGPGATAVT